MTTPLDAIRAQFPALQRRHEGQSVAYFDGPGGTQVPQRVVDAMADYLLHHNANTHWAYPTSAETDAMLRTHLIMEGDEQSVVKQIKLDPRAFHVTRYLRPTKVTG